jgi:hypothetical protein
MVLKWLPRWYTSAATLLSALNANPFIKCARAVGLEGKMTETVAGAALVTRINELIEELGDYPHARLTSFSLPKKQTTRMIKITCPECQYLVRAAAKWIEVGVPTCPCGAEMVADVPEIDPEEGEEPAGDE